MKTFNELVRDSYITVPHEREWNSTSQMFDRVKFARLVINEASLWATFNGGFDKTDSREFEKEFFRRYNSFTNKELIVYQELIHPIRVFYQLNDAERNPNGEWRLIFSTTIMDDAESVLNEETKTYSKFGDAFKIVDTRSK